MLYKSNLEVYLKNNFWAWNVYNFCYPEKPTLNYQFQGNSNIDCDEFDRKDLGYQYILNQHAHDKDYNLRDSLDDLNNSSAEYVDKNLLISKTVEEVLQSQALSDALKASPNYGRSKRRLYHLRQDVIIKIIFRWMRKYYLRDFKKFFNYTKWRSNNNSETNGEIIWQINRYLNKNFRGSDLEGLDIYFISIIDLKEKFISISENHRSLKENITELLYFYNKPKLVNLIKNSQFALLLFTFLNKHEILRLVVKSQNDAEVILAYAEQIQLLKCQWSISMKM